MPDLIEQLDARATWTDIVLPEEVQARLRELHDRMAQRATARSRTASTGRSGLVTALFVGPPGTGKTMAAEVLATSLGVALYRVDLSRVISKYIGETEKNLDRIFAAAEQGKAILFFDEADALFGKRTEVADSHDRYANIEVNYLLARMERYDGIAILATQAQQKLDTAFLRRFACVVRFPLPNASHRRRIWESAWPRGVGLAPDLQSATLARQFKLSGGAIGKAALAAASLAKAQGTNVSIEHVRQAIARDSEKPPA